MALLSGLTGMTKGVEALLFLDKATLFALAPVAADSWFSIPSNVKSVKIVYQSTVGRQEKAIVFDLSQSSPSSIVKFSTYSRDSFSLYKIILMDFENDIIEVEGVDLPTGLDISFATVPPVTTGGYYAFMNYFNMNSGIQEFYYWDKTAGESNSVGLTYLASSGTIPGSSLSVQKIASSGGALIAAAMATDSQTQVVTPYAVFSNQSIALAAPGYLTFDLMSQMFIVGSSSACFMAGTGMNSFNGQSASVLFLPSIGPTGVGLGVDSPSYENPTVVNMVADGNTCYILGIVNYSGTTNYKPIVWTVDTSYNVTSVILDLPGPGYTGIQTSNLIATASGHCYVYGSLSSNSGDTPGVWDNGTFTPLNLTGGYTGYVQPHGLVAAGNDYYFVGAAYDGNQFVFGYWRNTDPFIPLVDNYQQGGITDVTAFTALPNLDGSATLVVAGKIYTSLYYAEPCYWMVSPGNYGGSSFLLDTTGYNPNSVQITGLVYEIGAAPYIVGNAQLISSGYYAPILWHTSADPQLRTMSLLSFDLTQMLDVKQMVAKT